MKRFIALVFVFLFFAFAVSNLHAQCAMCQATAESSRDAGSSNSEGINKGVLYLFLTPDLLIGTVGFFWWRARKKVQE